MPPLTTITVSTKPGSHVDATQVSFPVNIHTCPNLYGKHLFEYHPETQTFTYKGKPVRRTRLAIQDRLKDLLADYAGHVLDRTIKAFLALASAHPLSPEAVNECCGMPWEYAAENIESIWATLCCFRGTFDGIEKREFFDSLIGYMDTWRKTRIEMNEEVTIFDFGEDVVEMVQLLLHGDENMDEILRRGWIHVMATHTQLSSSELMQLPIERLKGAERTDEEIAGYQMLEQGEYRDIYVYFLAERIMETEEEAFARHGQALREYVTECISTMESHLQGYLRRDESARSFYIWAGNILTTTREEMTEFLRAQRTGTEYRSMWINVALKLKTFDGFIPSSKDVDDASYELPCTLTPLGPVLRQIPPHEVNNTTGGNSVLRARWRRDYFLGKGFPQVDRTLQENRLPKTTASRPTQGNLRPRQEARVAVRETRIIGVQNGNGRVDENGLNRVLSTRTPRRGLYR